MPRPSPGDPEELRLELEALRRENAELRATEAQYRTLAEHSDAGIWHIRPGGETVALNPAMCRMLEIPGPEALDGRTAFEFFTEDSLAVMRREHSLRFLGMPSLYEVELVGARGTRRHVIVAGAPIFGRGGELESMIGTFRDVTEERRASAELYQARARLELALEATETALFEWDVLAGKVSFSLGSGVQTRTGSLAELMEARVLPEHRERVTRELHEALATARERFHLEYQTRLPDGSIRWRSARARVLRDELGEPLKVIGATIDVTDNKLLEARLAAAARLESLGRLAGGIAHDFNNLLTIISTSVQRARRPGGPVAEALADIDEAAECGSRLTQQLLAFARCQPMERTETDVGALLERMCDWLERALGSDIQLDLRIAPELPPVLADSGQLEQVVMNLVTNAREAMPGGGQLAIELETAGDRLVLRVSDTGAGMDESTRERAIEPFFTTKAAGTGLGLATTYGIVAQLGGSFELESAPGEGTTATVAIPSAVLAR